MRSPRNEPLKSAETGSGAEHGDVSVRRCILSGRIAPRDELVRLALSPEGQVLPDALARAPGRGAWIGVTRAELREAQDRGKLGAALARAFRSGKLSVPDDLPELVENALRRALAQRLGLELRAGRLIFGFDRIEGEARMGRVAALYHAADASADGVGKLDQALRVGMSGTADVKAQRNGLAGERLPLDRAALSVALGRANVVHLALADRGSAQRVLGPLRRLQNFAGAVRAAGDDGAPAAADASCDPAVTI